MTVYIIPIFLIGLFSLVSLLFNIDQAQRQKINSRFSIVVALTLITILSFRDPTVGVDVKGYLDFWAQAGTRDVSETTRFEPMFVKLSELSYYLSTSPQFYLTIIAILSLAPISFALRKGSSDPLFSWLIFICLGFYSFTFSGLRQAIAYGLTTLAIHFIRRRKLLPFLLLVGLAASFHFSALIFLPAYWIYSIRVKPIGVLIYFAALVPIFIFRAPIFQWFTAQFYSSYELSPSSSFSWLALSATIVALGWIRNRTVNNTNVRTENGQDTSGLLQIATVGVSLMLFASVGTNVMRMADYFYIAIIFALPSVLQTFNNPLRILVKVYIAGALILIYIIQMLGSPYSIVPYSAFFSSI